MVHAGFRFPIACGVRMGGAEVLFLELPEIGIGDFSRAVVAHGLRFSEMGGFGPGVDFLTRFLHHARIGSVGSLEIVGRDF